MTPDQNPAVRELLESRLDSLDTAIREMGGELRRGQERLATNFEGRLDRIETQVRTTNGRVTAIELQEAAAKALAEDHRRVQAMTETRRSQWTGILPGVIIGVCSGLTVLVASLILTGSL